MAESVTWRFGEYPDYEYIAVDGADDDQGMYEIEQYGESGLLVVEISEGEWRSVGEIDWSDFYSWESFWAFIDEWMELHGYE